MAGPPCPGSCHAVASPYTFSFAHFPSVAHQVLNFLRALAKLATYLTRKAALERDSQQGLPKGFSARPLSHIHPGCPSPLSSQAHLGTEDRRAPLHLSLAGWAPTTPATQCAAEGEAPHAHGASPRQRPRSNGPQRPRRAAPLPPGEPGALTARGPASCSGRGRSGTDGNCAALPGRHSACASRFRPPRPCLNERAGGRRGLVAWR